MTTPHVDLTFTVHYFYTTWSINSMHAYLEYRIKLEDLQFKSVAVFKNNLFRLLLPCSRICKYVKQSVFVCPSVCQFVINLI